MKLFPHFVFLLFVLSVYSQTAVVIADKAALRGTPSGKGKVVEQLKRDATVEIIKQNNAWFLVQSLNYAGWIHGDAIKLTSTEANISNKRPLVDLSNTVQSPAPKTRTTDSRTYIRGPRGGCYYVNSSGKKTYVDHSYCS